MMFMIYMCFVVFGELLLRLLILCGELLVIVWKIDFDVGGLEVNVVVIFVVLGYGCVLILVVFDIGFGDVVVIVM